MKNYKWWLLGLMMLSTFMAVLDTSIVNVGLPAIMRAFDAQIQSVEWIVTGYLLSMCVMLPSAGWLSDKYGYKKMFLIGMAVFTVGSLMCSISNSLNLLIISRILEGFGSGIIQPIALAVVIREFDSKQRGLALGLWAVSAAASVSMGPYLGGILVSSYSWNALFMVNVPIGIVTIGLAILIMKESCQDSLGKFDFIGFILIGLGLPILVVALALVGQYGWGSWIVISMILLAASMVWLFIRRSLKIESPLIDLKIFKNRNFAIATIALLFFGIGLYSGNYLLPLYLEHTLSYSAMAAGAVFLPVGLIQGALAPTTGILGRFTGNRILIFAGLLIFVSYFVVSAFFDATTPHYLIMISLYLRGLGIGLAFTPLNTIGVSGLQNSDMASASGVSNTVKQVSGSIGIAVFTALLSSRVAHHALTVSASQAYVNAISDSFWVSALLAALGLVAVMFLREKRAAPADDPPSAPSSAPNRK